MSAPTYAEQLQFLNNVQRVLNEGLFSATYKYALLMSLADLSIERGTDSGASYLLNIKDIAEKFIEYYWKHTLPYISTASDSGGILFQNSNPGKEAMILRVVKEMRTESNGSLPAAKRNRKLWSSSIGKVANLIRIMPLWKLQTVAKSELLFLYEKDPETERRGYIQLRPGVVYNFRRFHAIVKALVQESWIRFIRTLDANQRILGQTVDLAEFLFGSERAVMTALRPILFPLQSGRCFYCGGSLQETKGDLDHFIPWTKYSINLGHNFVLSHSSCNNSKSDFLPGVVHLKNWLTRNEQHATYLSDSFQKQNVLHDQDASMHIASWAYEQAEKSGSNVWILKKQVEPLNVSWRELFNPAQ